MFPLILMQRAAVPALAVEQGDIERAASVTDADKLGPVRGEPGARVGNTRLGGDHPGSAGLDVGDDQRTLIPRHHGVGIGMPDQALAVRRPGGVHGKVSAPVEHLLP